MHQYNGMQMHSRKWYIIKISIGQNNTQKWDGSIFIKIINDKTMDI